MLCFRWIWVFLFKDQMVKNITDLITGSYWWQTYSSLPGKASELVCAEKLVWVKCFSRVVNRIMMSIKKRGNGWRTQKLCVRMLDRFESKCSIIIMQILLWAYDLPACWWHLRVVRSHGISFCRKKLQARENRISKFRCFNLINLKLRWQKATLVCSPEKL